ncbi:hypothetical protein HOLDEFILI_02645 [Holdemania filiformis DSM 12042]|uniref:Uncharacterized protein n=1 Tax=Holdemania filiformis DSM 12042 TaxID=545696 RepID=B9Y9Y8_9FIRM|nr:hypothetical protein HOLDEFILI_02645 [Holdemania filiformis DSM 12042]
MFLHREKTKKVTIVTFSAFPLNLKSAFQIIPIFFSEFPLNLIL